MSNPRTLSVEETVAAAFGFYLAGGPGGTWLYVPAEPDADGAPLTWARPATPEEVQLWQAARYSTLAAQLVKAGLQLRTADGLPVLPGTSKPQSKWGRFLDGLRAIVGLRRDK